MRPFRLPSPLEIAAEQLEQAKRDLLMQEAAAEAHSAQAGAHNVQADMLWERIERLQEHINRLKEAK